MSKMIWCTSGGAPGADTLWTKAAVKAGNIVSIMTFPGHARTQVGGSVETIMPDEFLAEATEHVHAAAEIIKRPKPVPGSTTEKLLQRNWHIVKGADAVFAIGKIVGTGKGINLDGGTGWAGQMYYEMKVRQCKPILLFVFDMNRNGWYECLRDGAWAPCPMPTVTDYKSVGLIGSRDISEAGAAAIESVFADMIRAKEAEEEEEEEDGGKVATE